MDTLNNRGEESATNTRHHFNLVEVNQIKIEYIRKHRASIDRI